MTPIERLELAKELARSASQARRVDEQLRARGVDAVKLRARVEFMESRPADADVTMRPAPGCRTCKGSGTQDIVTEGQSVLTIRCACVRPFVESR